MSNQVKEKNKYEYLSKKHVDEMREVCDEIIKKLQKKVKDYFTFDPRLIGSGEKRLVTYEADSKSYDLDYNLILQRDKKNMIKNPKKVKEYFIQKLNEINPDYNFKFAENSTSVITSRLKTKINNFQFKFDLAIMYESNNGNLLKLVYDKPDIYIWNEVQHTKDYQKKYKELKINKKFVTVKKRYLDKKNDKNHRNHSSFSIFIETINEVYDGMKNDK